MYKIKAYSFRQAKKLNVIIKPSKLKGKKIGVFKKDGKKITDIGALGYGDYPTFLLKDKEMAKKRRIAYKKRHEKDRKVHKSRGWYADKILW